MFKKNQEGGASKNSLLQFINFREKFVDPLPQRLYIQNQGQRT